MFFCHGVSAMATRCTGRYSGMTLIELVTVLGILSLLMGLLLSGVQAARESARRLQCQNHLKQLVLAFHSHENAHRFLPTNGWGWAWAGDARRGFDQRQPGGWCFNILPYIEQEQTRQLALGDIATAQVHQTIVSTLFCPSRRKATLYPYTLSSIGLRNSGIPATATKTDYAVCAGDVIIDTPSGPPSDSPADINSYAWPPFQNATGVSYVRTQIRWADIRDGASQQIALGEKYLPDQHYTDGTDLGDDQSPFVGDDSDNRRWVQFPLRRDGASPDIQSFGGPHVAVCHFAFADGAVRPLKYNIELTVLRRLGNRHDGQAVALPD